MLNLKHQIRAEINLDNLLTNVTRVKKLVDGGEIIAVVKADGYGHGGVKVAEFLEHNGISFFAVSCIKEALELRKAGIKSKILILGYTDPEYAPVLADNNISQTVFSAEYAKEVSDNLCGKTLPVHIKLNTGMNRLGFNVCDNDQTREIITALSEKGIFFEGIFTHFAAADLSGDPGGKFTDLQFSRYKKTVLSLEKAGYKPLIRHTANSAASVLKKDTQLDGIRLGIIMYGLTPSDGLEIPIELSPVMSLKSTVSMVHKIKKGEKISYGLTFEAPQDMTLATVTAGYADGYPRFLSNKGRVIIGGEYCPVVGKVCMDQTVVDISHLDNVKSGDEVILMGECGDKKITADEIAAIGNTINYEIVCSVSRRVARIYYHNGKEIASADYLFPEE